MSFDVVLERFPLGLHWPTVDPFLFCAHHADAYPRGDGAQGPAASLAGRALGHDFEGQGGWRMYHGQRVPGFPQHPHRGFETITIVTSGFCDHSDSLGARARFGAGDVQWLTAGRGIVHSEMFPLLRTDGDNPLELFQLWLNLPRADKMVPPHFSMRWREQLPVLTRHTDGGGRASVTVVAGDLHDVHALPAPPHSYAARPDSDVAIWLVSLEPGARLPLPPARHARERMVYLVRGGPARLDDEVLEPGTGARVRAERALDVTAGPAPCELLVIQGAPLHEPVAWHGPFVMNTPAELEAAYRDFHATRFGGWPFERDDPVHGDAPERFARHPDGREDLPPSRR